MDLVLEQMPVETVSRATGFIVALGFFDELASDRGYLVNDDFVLVRQSHDKLAKLSAEKLKADYDHHEHLIGWLLSFDAAVANHEIRGDVEPWQGVP